MENTNNKKSSLILLAGIIAVIVIIAIGAVIFFLSNKSYRTIKVVEVEGNVTVSNEKENSHAAYVDMLLKNKDKVETAEDGRLALLLDEQKAIEVYPLSVVHVVATGNSEKNNTKTTLVLEKGSILNEVNTHLGEEENYEVQTPSVCMAVRGTKFKVESRKNDVGTNETYIEVTDGTVEAYRDGEADTVKIDAGYNVIIGEGDKLSEVTLAENLPYVEFGFDINDLYVFGIPGKEMTVELFKNEILKIREKYDINTEKYTPSGVLYYVSADDNLNLAVSAPDRKSSYMHGNNGTWVECEERYLEFPDTTTYTVISGNFNMITSIIYDEGYVDFGKIYAQTTSSDMRELLCTEELESLFIMNDEGRLEANIKCNWSNDTYTVSYYEDSNDYIYYLWNEAMDEMLTIKLNKEDKACKWEVMHKR